MTGPSTTPANGPARSAQRPLPVFELGLMAWIIGRAVYIGMLGAHARGRADGEAASATAYSTAYGDGRKEGFAEGWAEGHVSGWPSPEEAMVAREQDENTG